MAVLTKAANANHSVTTGWTSPTNAYADDTNNATCTPASKSTVDSEFGFPAFTTAEIPDGSTLNSVTVYANVWGSNSGMTTRIRGVIATALVGVESTSTSTSSTNVISAAVTGATLDDLRTGGNVEARVGATQGNRTSYNGTLDYVYITVDWSPAAQTVSPTGIGTAEAFGSPDVSVAISKFDQTVSPTGIATVENLGAPVAQVGAITVTASGIATDEGFGSPTLTITGGLIYRRGFARQTNASSTTQPIPMPSGIQAGDVLVAVADMQTISSWTPPDANWSFVGYQNYAWMWIKVADGTETGSLNWTAASATTAFVGCAAYVNVDNAHPQDATYTKSSGTTTSASFAGPITVNPNTMIVAIIASALSISETGPLNEVWELNNGTQYGEFDDSIQAATGSATLTWTVGYSGSNAWNAVAAALRQASAVVPQTVSVTGIGTAEAFGSPTLIPSAISVAVTGIASAEAFGSPGTTKGAISVTVAGIASAEAIGQPGSTKGSISLAPTGIATAEALGSIGSVKGGISVSPTGMASVEAFGSPGSTKGGISASVAGIAGQEAFGSPTIQTGSSPAQSVAPAGIGSAEAFGTPAISVGLIWVSPTGITSGEAVGAPKATPGAITRDITGISTAEAFGMPEITISGGRMPQTLEILGIPSGELLGSLGTLYGAIEVVPTGITSEELLGLPVMIPGAVTVQLDGVAPEESLGWPEIDVGAITAPVDGIASAEAFGLPELVVPLFRHWNWQHGQISEIRSHEAAITSIQGGVVSTKTEPITSLQDGFKKTEGS